MNDENNILSYEQNIEKKDSDVAIKISLTIFFVLFFASGLTSLLTYFNFSKSYNELTLQRNLVVAQNIQKSIEYSLNFGLRLKEINNIKNLVDDVKIKYNEVKDIYVIDNSNNVLFHSGKNSHAFTADELKRTKTIESSSNRVLTLRDDTYLFLPLENNYQAKAGVLVLTYTNNYISNKMQDVIYFLAKNTVVSVLLVSLVVTLFVYFITGGFKSRLVKMNDSLENLLKDPLHESDISDADGALEKNYLEFHEKAQELFLSFNAVERSLSKITEGKDDEV